MSAALQVVALAVALIAPFTSRAENIDAYIVTDYMFALDIYFPVASAQVSAINATKINQRLAEAYYAAPKVKEWCALAVGYVEHPESTNSSSRRRGLALRRATAAKEVLVLAGLSDINVQTEVSASFDLLYPSGDPKNRRTEVEIFPCLMQ